MKVCILHDEVTDASRPDEADALVQAAAIGAALAELGHESWNQALTLDLAAFSAAMRARRPDLVFNIVESLASWGRLIYLGPAILDTLGIPYTGVRTDAMYLTSNKVLTKCWLHAHGLTTPGWHAPGAVSGKPLPLPCRCIVKSVWEDASVGLDDDAVVTAQSLSALDELVRSRASRLGGEAFAEEYIEGREINLSVIGTAEDPRVLPPAEIEFIDFPADKPRIVGYAAKWDEDSAEYRGTPRRFGFSQADGPMLAQANQAARDCWRLFGLRGYARVDFRVDASGVPYILEVNSNPCLSPDAGLAAAAGQAGLSLTEVIGCIVADALHTSRPGIHS